MSETTSQSPYAVGNDQSINADIARTTYGVTGAGVKVGVVSDSFALINSGQNSYAADILAGALPPDVDIAIEGTDGIVGIDGDADEGRALAQIVDRIAPGVSLEFASGQDLNGDNDVPASTLEARLAGSINRLIDDGCQVITMDVGLLSDPFYQLGSPVQAAIQRAVDAGVSFFNAAGNSDHNDLEANWQPTTADVPGVGTVTAHDFGAGDGTLEPVTIRSGQRVELWLQEDKPFPSITGSGGAQSSLTMYLLDGQNQVVATSTPSPDGDPWTQLLYAPPADAQPDANGQLNYRLAVVDTGGFPAGRFKIETYKTSFGGSFDPSNSGFGSGSLGGDNLIPGENVVGAVDYRMTPRFGASVPVLESFSSGGTGELRRAPDGTPYDPSQSSGGVTFTGPDGGLSSTFGTFRGTSAASPSAAGVAALMLQSNPELTNRDITHLLQDSALPMGISRDFQGAGFIQADRAVAYAATGVIQGFAGGNTTLYGTHLGSQLIATTASNTFVIEGGSNTVLGLSGGNTVSYKDAAGAVTVDLGAGVATENGFGGTDSLFAVQNLVGGQFGDTILAETGDHAIRTGTGANTVRLGSGTNQVDSQGSDTIIAGSGADTITVSGNTEVFAGTGRLSLINGAGHAVVNGGDAVTVQGGAGSVAILDSVGDLRGGTVGGNVIQAGTGGVSTLYGAGDGDLLITSGNVNNQLFAGAGSEILDGSGSNGDNVFVGGTGSILVRAGAGSDTVLAGNSTRLTLDAQGPGDKNVVLGGGGADLTLGSGHALVQAGSDAATITGGAGPDEYRFINGSAGGQETITNFKVGIDQLAFAGYGDELANLRGIDGGSVLTLSDNTSITLLGVTDLPRTAFV